MDDEVAFRAAAVVRYFQPVTGGDRGRHVLWQDPQQRDTRLPARAEYQTGYEQCEVQCGDLVTQSLPYVDTEQDAGDERDEHEERTDDGEAVFGEIGARPGGAHLVDQMNYTCDVDLFVEWARAVCWGRFEGDTMRKYNCAITFKRAKGAGAIRAVRGMDALRRRCGRWLIEERLLPVGSPRRNWRHTLVSDGYLMFRHPEWEAAKAMAFAAATEVELIAG